MNTDHAKRFPLQRTERFLKVGWTQSGLWPVAALFERVLKDGTRANKALIHHNEFCLEQVALAGALA